MGHFGSGTLELEKAKKEQKEKLWIDFQLTLDTPPEQWPEALKQKLVNDSDDSEDLYAIP